MNLLGFDSRQLKELPNALKVKQDFRKLISRVSKAPIAARKAMRHKIIEDVRNILEATRQVLWVYCKGVECL